MEEAGLLPESSDRKLIPIDETEWIEVKGVGNVFRLRQGPAVLVSPMPVSTEMLRAMPSLLAFDSRQWLHGVQTRALIIAGTKDSITPLAHARPRGHLWISFPAGGGRQQRAFAGETRRGRDGTAEVHFRIIQ